MARDIRIFLSSPGDVNPERDLAQWVIENLNNDAEFREQFHLILYRWDDPNVVLPMPADDTPQQSVNVYMTKPSACDLVVVLFWSRMGTKLVMDGREYLSGTHYEYTDALESKRASGRPDVWLYHCTREPEVKLTDQHRDSKIQQFDLVQQFFKGFRDEEGRLKGGVNQYSELDAFGSLFEKQLRTHLRHLLKHPETSKLTLVPKLEGAPYRGLLALNESDAAIFFGRERETLELLTQVERDPFVFVVGASGSGKSSLAAAGVLPHLRARGNWFIFRCVPGGDPYFNLMLGLVQSLTELKVPIEDYLSHVEQFKAHIRPGGDILENLLKAVLPDNMRVLIYIDQFEELYTQAAKEQNDETLQAFVALLRYPNPHVTVLATLRADFYEAALTHFEQELRHAFSLGKPSAFALHEMIVRPAVLADFKLDDRLAETIVDEVYDQPGGLPLVAYLLEELYLRAKKRRDRQLTHDDYEDLGGVRGAIGRRAEEVFNALTTEAQGALPHVFHELIEVDERGTATRRRALQATVTPNDGALKLVNAFIKARLLTISMEDPQTVLLEVAHEALLREWPKLVNWIYETQDDLRLLRRVRQAAHDWDAMGRPTENYAFWTHEMLIPVEIARQNSHVVLDEITILFTQPEYERLFSTFINLDSSSPHWPVKLERLAEIGEAAVPMLLVGLNNSNDQVRWNAAKALDAIKLEQKLRGLVTALNDDEVDIRRIAVHSLSEMRSEHSIDGLVVALNDDEVDIRRIAVQSLREIRSERSIDGLVVALNDDEVDIRRIAVQSLREMRSERSVDGLVTVLNDPDAKVRDLAAWALGEIQSERGVDGLLGALNDLDVNVRWNAAISLFKIKSERSVDGLLGALNDPEESVRNQVAQALRHIGSVRSVDKLLEVLNDPDVSVRQSAAEALRAIKSERSVDGLLALLKDADVRVRWGAAEALRAIKSERSVDGLLALLNDADVRIRRSATETLGAIKSERSVDGLLALLNDADVRIRRSATETLGAIKSERSVDGLLALLNDADVWIRRSATKTLGAIKSERSVDGLLALLKDADMSVRQSAAEALKEIKSERSVDGLLALLYDTDASVRRSAVEILGAIKSEQSVDGLLALLYDTDASVRRSVAEALGAIKSERSVDNLLDLLNDLDGSMRRSIIKALGAIKSERSVDKLLGLLNDLDGSVRRSASEALKEIKSERSVDGLLTLLYNPDARIRRIAAETLGAIKSERSVKSLLIVLNDRAVSVQRIAAEALQEIGTPEALEAVEKWRQIQNDG